MTHHAPTTQGGVEVGQHLNQAAQLLAKGGLNPQEKAALVHAWATFAKEMLKGHR